MYIVVDKLSGNTLTVKNTRAPAERFARYVGRQNNLSLEVVDTTERCLAVARRSSDHVVGVTALFAAGLVRPQIYEREAKKGTTREQVAEVLDRIDPRDARGRPVRRGARGEAIKQTIDEATKLGIF
jgi:hypothetical protein